MSRHRAEPPPRFRVRYGRTAVLGLSAATTVVGLLGGIGVLPSAADDPPARSARASLADNGDDRSPGSTPDGASDGATDAPAPEPAQDPTQDPAQDPSETSGGQSGEETTPEPSTPAGPTLDDTLPDDSGSGRRVVFSEERQRVWLVDDDDQVERTYLVSGSVFDNLDPGSYKVYSRSPNAYGIEDSGTMKWFVRFAHGDTGAAIGFHSIPVKDGKRLQTAAELGTPTSHGCIRQRTADAKAMWSFAPNGTDVEVVA